ncbi:unnamed protein product [Rotaria sp. Silwood1]|nr:unnamed protein product [Rotaria sp. Silwood1]
MIESTANTTRLVQPRIIENFIIIWLDSNINEFSEGTRNSISNLRQVVNSIKIFSDIDKCVDFLTDIEDEKVFMIISNTFGQQTVSLIGNIAQLHSIYIICSQSTEHQSWIDDYKNVKGIFNKIESICDLLRRNIRQYEMNLISLSVVPTSSFTNLDELDQSFMYSQILKEIILDIKHNKVAKKEFVDFCCTHYADNDTQSNKIRDFERLYEHHSPIWWYTKEPFIYAILNKALRTQEIDVIIKMGFFIQDLHRQIEQLHKEANQTSKMIIYRGQGMSNDDFEKIKKSEGGLLSFNNFLSTSIDQDVSYSFAESAGDNPQLIGILFQIEIDPLISTVSFASLDNTSQYSDSEKEILFSMHTVFRIGKIKKIKDRLWQVNLTLTNDNDQQLKQLTDHIRKEHQQKNGWHRMAVLMTTMGKFNKALEIFNLIREKSSTANSNEQFVIDSAIYHDIAVAYRGIGDNPNALAYFQKTLEMQRKFLPHNHPELITTYNNIGSINDIMGNYSIALSYYQMALEIQKTFFPTDDPSLAITYGNIGAVHNSMGNYPAALSYYKQTLKIEHKSLPANHPNLAATYEQIGSIYGYMGDYSTALSYHKKGLEIQQKTLPPDHPNLATTYKNMGEGYRMLGDSSTALSYYEKTLDIELKSLQPSHPSIANTYSCIAAIYHMLQNYPIALSYYEKALGIKQRSFPSDHPSIAKTYSEIGSLHESIEDYSTALSYYEKALKIEQKSLPFNHPSLAYNYNKIGSVYDSMNNYPSALSYYRKALDIQQKSLPPNHADLANTYNNIALIYQSTDNYSTALSYYQKTLEMKETSHPYNQSLIATAYNNIGEMHRSKGDYLTALSYYEKTLSIWQKFLPPNHTSLAILNANMAMAFKGLCQYKEAIKHAEQAVNITRCNYGLRHSRTMAYQKLLDDLQRNE